MKLIAACAFGLEAVVKRELQTLGYTAKIEKPGRISFQGEWDDVCRANIWLRTADRVLIEIASFPAGDFDALFETARDIDWAQWIPAEAAFPVTGRSRKSQLTSVPAIQRTVKKAIVEALRRGHATSNLPESGATFRVDAALLDDTATLTLDTTGASLHKRGYRKLVGPAPLKETLAAAMISLSVWNPDRPLIDPFCGSGTIPIEAALIGLNIAPGQSRDFTAVHWPQIGQDTWQRCRRDAILARRQGIELQIIGTDRDPEVLQLARHHAVRAGVEQHIHFQQKSFADLRSKREYGCLITNPPYGERLEDSRRLNSLYESFPAVLQRLPSWSHFILTSMPLEKIIHKRATRRRKLFNGRIECTYYQFLGPKPPSLNGSDPSGADSHREAELSEATAPVSVQQSPVFGGLTEKDQEQAELFATRLRKRAKHLRRWPKRGITCYRLYERDIPELPFVVDRYEDQLHMTEYDRPHERDLGRHAGWLELMKKTAAEALELPIHRVHLKTRKGQPGKSQYEQVSRQRKFSTVHEGGLEFLVNLTDYIDTGLFLDHRITRSMVREEAAGKRFLNLFAYTGSFSVYAAAGGAASTTTVDLSKNYLDWAARNMRTNGFDGPQHQFVHADSLTFIEQAASRGQTFDLVVVDPPTFSNSKQTDEDWEVQGAHADLLNSLVPILSPGAVVFFSTNFRRFKLDESQVSSNYRIIEITRQTIPEDFRNKRIHRCWKLIRPD